MTPKELSELLRLEEELEIEQARNNFLAFVRYTKPNYQVNWHHRVITAAADALIQETTYREFFLRIGYSQTYIEHYSKIKHPVTDLYMGMTHPEVLDEVIYGLMVCVAPRTGKSEIMSRRLPAYILGKNPDTQIIATSYGSDLASRMNRDVQRIMDAPMYATLFPGSSLNESNVRSVQGGYLRNSDIFEVVGHAGSYRSAGVGGAITGMGANCLTGDALVLTENGPIPIQDFWDMQQYPGVWGVDCETGIKRLCRVKAVQRKRVARVVTASFSDGSAVTCTPEHLFLKEDMRYIAAKDMAYQSARFLSFDGAQEQYVECTGVAWHGEKEVEVFDIEVEDCHNFFADRLCVHNCAIVDDPIRSRADADSPLLRQKVWDWYTSTLHSRLEKNARRIVIMCMTGDTPVRMADGTERPLAQVRPGDRVATYEDGKLVASAVLNWANQGPDFIYRIRTSSGITVKANARHPFLVCREGRLLWVRLKDLRRTDRMMRAAEHIKALPAPQKVASSLQNAKPCVCCTTEELDGPQDIVHHPQTSVGGGAINSSIATALNMTPMRLSWLSSEGAAQSANGHLCRVSTCRCIGRADSALTIATPAAGCEDCCVTIATSSLNTLSPRRCCKLQSFTCEAIAEIKPAGHEDVFDIQVERTENFIANGLVAHNTRWHEDDLSGRLISKAGKDKEIDQWLCLSFPSILDQEPSPGDPRKQGEALWPEKYNLRRVNQIRKTIDSYEFEALHQQRPRPPGGRVFHREWWQYYDRLPEFTRMIVSCDLAFDDTGDNTGMLVMGQAQENIYIIDDLTAQMTFVQQEETLKKLFIAYPGLQFAIVEKAANGSALKSSIKKRNVSIPIILVPPVGSKTFRAQLVTPHLMAGTVYLPREAMWLKAFMNELEGFPKAAHDDRVDAFSQGVSYLTKKGQALRGFDSSDLELKKTRYLAGLDVQFADDD